MADTQNERNGLRRRKRRIACHQWVCWWAWSPILELQTWGQLSHGQALRLLRGWAPFRTALLCTRASTCESSNWVTASWHRVLQAERSWVTSPRERVDATLLQIDLHSIFVPQYWPTLQTFSRCQLSKKYLLWNPTVWHAHDVTDPSSCALSRKASIPIIPQVSNTSVLGILSCHLTRAVRHDRHTDTQIDRYTDRQTPAILLSASCYAIANFVAMATRDSPFKIWLTSLDSLIAKTPCYRRYLLYKSSYSRFCLKLNVKNLSVYNTL